MNKHGIVIVSHVHELAYGLSRLLNEIAPNISITYAGGMDDGGVGTSYEKVLAACNENTADFLLCFYDLGSAKMTLDMVLEEIEKPNKLYNAALVEGTFTAATLAQAELELSAIEEQLNSIIIK